MEWRWQAAGGSVVDCGSGWRVMGSCTALREMLQSPFTLRNMTK